MNSKCSGCSLRRIPAPGGCRPMPGCGCSSMASCRSPSRRWRSARQSSGGCPSRVRSRQRWRRPARCYRTYPPGLGWSWCRAASRGLRSSVWCRCRPGGRWRCWSARMARSRTAWSNCPLLWAQGRWRRRPTISPSRLAGRTLMDAARAMRAEIAAGQSALDAASRDLVERGLAVWSEDAARRPVLIVRGQANLLDEAALMRYRAGALAARRSGKPAIGCRIARSGPRGRCDADFHRLGEPFVRAFRLIGDRFALPRPRGKGGRRDRGNRPDAVELCAPSPHGGFHRPIAGQTHRLAGYFTT